MSFKYIHIMYIVDKYKFDKQYYQNTIDIVHSIKV